MTSYQQAIKSKHQSKSCFDEYDDAVAKIFKEFGLNSKRNSMYNCKVTLNLSFQIKGLQI